VVSDCRITFLCRVIRIHFHLSVTFSSNSHQSPPAPRAPGARWCRNISLVIAALRHDDSNSVYHYIASTFILLSVPQHIFPRGSDICVTATQSLYHNWQLSCTLTPITIGNMSSPTPADLPADNVPSADADADVDVDAEMTDAQNASGPIANGISSTVEPDSAPEQPSTTASHHNRKDATLREFLSKMDDYAPIVSLLKTCLPLRTSSADPRQ
jgi:hypothetical protein